jgi:hypothetical protein
MIRAASVLAASSLLMLAGGAMAQTISVPQPISDDFIRNGDVSVMERPRPEYDAQGLILGNFIAYPTLQVGAEENDNIYASQANRRSDTILTVSPKVDLKSSWSAGGLDLFLLSNSREYSRYSSETSTDYQAGGQGGLDLGGTRVTASGDYGQLTEARTSPDTPLQAVRPIVYNQGDASIGAIHEFNRIRLSGQAAWESLDYRNGVDPTGAVVFQQDRNHDVETLTGRAEYALDPDAALLMSVVYNNHNYQLVPPATDVNRNSHGATVEFGANFDLTRLIRGEVRIGYLQQDFDDPKFRQVSGLSAYGKVEWFALQSTTVTFSGSRSVQDAAISESPAYLANVVGVQADYELRRDVILSGRGGYETDQYLASDRNDRILNGALSATYLMNRRVGFTLACIFLDQHSTGAAAGPIFTVNRYMLSTKLQF